MLIICAKSTGQNISNQESSQLTEKLNYHAKDSIVIDLENKKTFLYSEAHIDYGEIILDVGCGQAIVAASIAAARKNSFVFGIDIDEDNIFVPVTKYFVC